MTQAIDARYPAELVAELERRAKEFRREIIKMISAAGSGHPGGSLSVIDILTALYFHILRHNPKNPSWAERDRLFLSKGHASAALYTCLAYAGYFPREWLGNYRKFGSPLQGHPDVHMLPGIEMPGGSLGQGLSVANGCAMAGKMDGRDYRVFCVLGDGEIDEGSVWEATMTATHHKLDNVTAILDANTAQQTGYTKDIKNTDPKADKWRAFGWTVYEIDGHDFNQILWALQPERVVPDKPTFVVAHTIKGKGVSFMEGAIEFHGKAPTAEETKRALEELA
jgi:transketolase